MGLIDDNRETKVRERRKRPLWPWLALLVLTLIAIYAHQQFLSMIEDFKLLARDVTQVAEWLGSFLPD